MTASPHRQLNLLELARQGHPQAIADLLNTVLQPRGITAKATLDQSCLQVSLTCDRPLRPANTVTLIHQALLKLQPPAIATLQITAQIPGQPLPTWQENLPLTTPPITKPEPESESQSVDAAAAVNPPPLAALTPEAEVPLVPELESPTWATLSLPPLPPLPEVPLLAAGLPLGQRSSETLPPVRQTVQLQSPPTMPVVIQVRPSDRPFTRGRVRKIAASWRNRFAGITTLLLGLGFCATGVGAVLGIPLLTGGLSLLQEVEQLEGACPHCQASVKVSLPYPKRFACLTCHQPIQVEAEKFYAANPIN